MPSMGSREGRLALMTKVRSIVAAASGALLVSSPMVGCGPGTGIKICSGKMCAVDSDCAPPLKCNVTSGSCVQCNGDSDCTTGLKKCGPYECLQCAADSDCTVNGAKIGLGTCDPAHILCESCATDADCKTPALPRCNAVNPTVSAYHQCSQCSTDADCSGQGFTGCDALHGTCSTCKANRECAAVHAGSTCFLGLCTCFDDSFCKGRQTCQPMAIGSP